MSVQFRAFLQPPASLIERLEACDPTNPLHTSEYAKAQESLGEQACFIGLYSHNDLQSGCLGLLSGSFLRRNLHIRSLPNVTAPAVFWSGLTELCRASGVWRLQVNTYASQWTEIPQLPGELGRLTRWEYVLDLAHKDGLRGVNPKHRRNISRAAASGISIRRTREPSACVQHLEVMRASMKRRADRGESVDPCRNHARESALLASGSGELFQAVSGEEILSSGLVLRSRRGAYYQSSGTSPEGMKRGASHFLISGIADILNQEGICMFNLGGVTADNPGLRSFKAGFGAREVELQAASFCPRSAAERKLDSAVRACWKWVRPSRFGRLVG